MQSAELFVFNIPYSLLRPHINTLPYPITMLQMAELWMFRTGALQYPVCPPGGAVD